MSGFTVNLDLTVYFDDLRKFSSVYVDLSKCSYVGDLVKHIKCVFRLEENICLVNNKFLLPSKENINILISCDTIKVKKCDFFDQQIHKSNEASSGCSQSALNLIQLERTIDLSCKPKQRLRLNSSHSSNKPEALSTPFVESNKTHLGLHQEWSASSTSDETSPVQKCRKSKKQQDVKSKAQDVNCREHNCLDILDMSVKKARKQNNENSILASEDCEIICNSKKRKLNSSRRVVGSSVDMQENQSSSWKQLAFRPTDFLDDSSGFESLPLGNFIHGATKPKKRKKHKDKNILLNNEEIESCHTQEEFVGHTHSLNEEIPQKQKQKKTRKSAKPLENIEKDYSSQFSCTLESDLTYKETSNGLLQHNHSTKSDSIPKNCLEERKIVCTNEIDALISNINKAGSNTINSSIYKSHGSKDSNESGGEEHEHVDGNKTTYGHNSLSGEQSIQSYSEFLDTNLKRRRVRKHNKKKKRERNQYLSALGPVLKNLPIQEVKSSPMPSETAKHVFFTDDDLIEEQEISSPIQLQTELGAQDSSKLQNANSSQEQEVLSTRLASWQQELLKLSNDSKPVVFHRKTTPVNLNKLNIMSKSQNGDSKSNLLCNTNKDVNMEAEYANSCEHNASIEQDTNTEVFAKCNGKMDIENGVSKNLSLEATCNKIIDTSKPIVNDIQNIILTNYPVVEKVVDGDLVIFKVLKLHENGEPGVSEVVLGKIISSTCFPDSLSIEIIQGCDELDSYNYTDSKGNDFVIELRWTDLIEPRLLYP